MIVAEFPAQNAIAVQVLQQEGFPALVDIFAKKTRRPCQ